MSAPPLPPREASTAAHLWLVWGAGAERDRRAPSLFHVNNKYSHPRPRLVCARRLQSSARGHSPGAARGAAAGIAPGVANRFAPTSHLGSRRRNPEGREAPGFGVTELPRRGREEDARPVESPPRYITQPSATWGPEMSTVLILTSPHPPTEKGGSRIGGRGRRGGEGAGRRIAAGKALSRSRLPAEPGPTRAGAHGAPHPERAVEAASPAPPPRAQLRKGPP